MHAAQRYELVFFASLFSFFTPSFFAARCAAVILLLPPVFPLHPSPTQLDLGVPGSLESLQLLAPLDPVCRRRAALPAISPLPSPLLRPLLPFNSSYPPTCPSAISLVKVRAPAHSATQSTTLQVPACTLWPSGIDRPGIHLDVPSLSLGCAFLVANFQPVNGRAHRKPRPRHQTANHISVPRSQERRNSSIWRPITIASLDHGLIIGRRQSRDSHCLRRTINEIGPGTQSTTPAVRSITRRDPAHLEVPSRAFSSQLSVSLLSFQRSVSLLAGLSGSWRPRLPRSPFPPAPGCLSGLPHQLHASYRSSEARFLVVQSITSTRHLACPC